MSATTSSPSIVFTATGIAGSVFETQLPTSVPASGITLSILSGGVNPIEFHASHAIQLLIVQLVIIIALSRGMSAIASFLIPSIKQPRVCFEILAGILLGPTAFGQIPGFSENIFPSPSLPFINLVATIGLVLFLFVIGLEVDFTLFKKNLRPSLAVSLAGLVIPFGLGCAVSVGLYNEFVDPEVTFTTFMCFIGTSSSITAFPVLGRILVDLKLMSDPVGVVVLASGVANDVIGWMLLALSVALATSTSKASGSEGGGGGSGLVVLWILFFTIGWILFLYMICRPLLNLVARRTNSFDSEVSQTYILAVLILVLISAWVMAAIGISEIFGGFLVGLIVPNSLGHHIAAKIEDLCICIFIPLYFAYSGLRTNLTLLNTGVIWGWTVCVIAAAFCGKFFGCFGAARLTGFTTRESAAVGFLMSAKGLIELIILNQGLSVGIINETVFSIFVLEALILTFAATPGTLLCYPASIRRNAIADSSSISTTFDEKQGGNDIDDGLGGEAHDSTRQTRTRFTVVLDKLESLGPLFIITSLLGSTSSPSTTIPSSGNADLSPEGNRASPDSSAGKTSTSSTITVKPLRLIELTERLSGVLLASDAAAEHLKADPLTSLYRTFASVSGGRGVRVDEGNFVVTQSDNFADTVKEKSEREGSQMVIVPWTLGEKREEQDSVIASYIPNPFESLFGNPSSTNPSSSTQSDSSLYAGFLRDLFASSSCDVGLFFDRGMSSAPSFIPSSTKTQLFLPFFGGSDDRACLEIAIQLSRRSPSIAVTVLAVQRAPEETEEDRADATNDSSSSMLKTDSEATGSTVPLQGPSLQLTVGGGGTHNSAGARPGETLYPTTHGLASETEDDLALERARAIPSATLVGSLTISQVSTALPLKTMIRRATVLASPSSASSSEQDRLIILVGRSRRDASSHRTESLGLLKEAEKEGTLGICASTEVRKCIGEAASAVLCSGVGDNLWVVQSGKTGGKRVTKAFRGGEA